MAQQTNGTTTNEMIAAYRATFGSAFGSTEGISAVAAKIAVQNAEGYNELAAGTHWMHKAADVARSYATKPDSYDGQASQPRMQREAAELGHLGWREVAVGSHFAMRSPDGNWIVRYVREAGRKQVRSYFERAPQSVPQFAVAVPADVTERARTGAATRAARGRAQQVDGVFGVEGTTRVLVAYGDGQKALFKDAAGDLQPSMRNGNFIGYPMPGQNLAEVR